MPRRRAAVCRWPSQFNSAARSRMSISRRTISRAQRLPAMLARLREDVEVRDGGAIRELRLEDVRDRLAARALAHLGVVGIDHIEIVDVHFELRSRDRLTL